MGKIARLLMLGLVVAGGVLRAETVPLPLPEGGLKTDARFGGLPSGRETLADVDWVLPAGQAVLVGADETGDAVEAVRGIAVGRQASVVHFLHTFAPGPAVAEWHDRALAACKTGDKPPEPLTVARYVVRYEDGRSLEVPVRWNESIGGYRRDFWNPVDRYVYDLAWARIAWEHRDDPNDWQGTVLYAMYWPNPRPEVAIRSVDVLQAGAGDAGSLALLGVSAETDMKSTGAVYFVSPTGNDDDAGTFDRPWASLHKAASIIDAGETVYVRGGEYRLKKRILFEQIGREGTWTRIIGYPGETATLNCIDVLWDRSPDRVQKGWETYPHDVGMLLVHRCTHFVVKNLWLEMSRSRGLMAEYGDHIEFLYNRVYKTYAPAMRIGRGEGPGYRAIGNILRRGCCRAMCSGPDDELGDIQALTGHRNPPCEQLDVGTLVDFEIAHNEISWGDKECMLLDGSMQRGRVHHNYVHDAHNRPWVAGISPNGYGNPEDLEMSHNVVHDVGTGLGVGTEGGGHTRDVRIHHNIVFDCYWSGIGVGTWNGPVTGVAVHNNTVHHCGYLESNRRPAGGICISGNPAFGGPKEVRVYHNILTGNRDYNIALNGDAALGRDDIRIERNLIGSFANNTWGTTWVAHQGDKPIREDPLYVDAESLDFRLRPESPAIDAGMTHGKDFDPDGTPPDLGAMPFKRPPVPIPPAGEGFVLRVNAGCTEDYEDAKGRTWRKEPWRRGDGAYGPDRGAMVDRGDKEIPGTDSPRIYLFERYGVNTYSFKVPPGVYQVVLHFAETWHTEPGRRVFGVTVNGRTLLEDFDVFAEAGNRAFVPVVRDARVTAYDEIEIGFKGKVGQPIINGIEIIQVTRDE